jgi:hypothetical protein
MSGLSRRSEGPPEPSRGEPIRWLRTIGFGVLVTLAVGMLAKSPHAWGHLLGYARISTAAVRGRRRERLTERQESD